MLTTENVDLTMIPKLIRCMVERRTNRERWVRTLKNAVVPIRLINGIEDPIYRKHAADWFAEVVPNADLVLLEKPGHYPRLETPKEVIEAFFEFHDALEK